MITLGVSIKLISLDSSLVIEIKKLAGMSGHADKNGLLHWISGFEEKPRKVFVVHGEDSVCNNFVECLKVEQGQNAYAPYSGTVFNLLTGKLEYDLGKSPQSPAAVNHHPAGGLLPEMFLVYRLLLPFCDTAHITRIDHAYEADSWFPDLDRDPEWEIRTEGHNVPVLRGVGLQPLKYGLGVLQNPGALIQHHIGVLRKTAPVPGPLFIVGHIPLLRSDQCGEGQCRLCASLWQRGNSLPAPVYVWQRFRHRREAFPGVPVPAMPLERQISLPWSTILPTGEITAAVPQRPHSAKCHEPPRHCGRPQGGV